MKYLLLLIFLAGIASADDVMVSSTTNVLKVDSFQVTNMVFSDGKDKIAVLYWDEKTGRLKFKGDTDIAVKRLFEKVAEDFNHVIEQRVAELEEENRKLRIRASWRR